MRSVIRLFLGLVCLLSFATLSVADVPTLHRDSVDELGRKIHALQKEYSVVGLSAVAVNDGKVVWNTNFGLADIERDMRVTDKTKFRIASISKTVATTALMQLWEKKKFKLDDDISRYLGYPVVNPHNPHTPITFRHLLTHTSSLTDNSNYDRFLQLTYDAADRAPAIREILSAGGAHYNEGANFTTNAPGQNYRYCNLAFGVVGTLVEKISGQRFDEYCRKNILAPLGMTASFNFAHLPDINDLAVLYSGDENNFKPQTDNFRGVKPDNRIGASYKPGHNALVFGPQGGLRVSALDLSKFMMQFMERKSVSSKSKPILKKSTIDLMLQEQWTNEKESSARVSRGLGFQRTQNELRNEFWIGHTGSAYGLLSSMFFLPKESTGIIIFTNGSKPGKGEREVRGEMAEVILNFLRASGDSAYDGRINSKSPDLILNKTSPLQIDTNFPSGNIIVEKMEGDTVNVRTDLRDTDGWWFYWCFRVRGAAGKTLTFNFTEGAPIGVRGPGVSLDEGVTWRWLGKQPDNKSFKYSFPPDADSVRFSFGMPYTEANLKTFLKRIGDNPALKKEILCQSRKGRDVERLRIGKLKSEPDFRVMITCRAHCCEMMTSYVAEGLIDAALSDDKDGKWFRKHVEMLVIPFLDKDGVEDGDQGKKRKPRDHNRDYDTNAIYPETRAIQKFVPQWSAGKLRLSIDLHCPHIRGNFNEFIYLVGSAKPKIWEQQERFGEILERVQNGPLVYRATNNLPFGQAWNTAENFTAGPSVGRWAGELPGVKLATTIEFPYANVLGNEVNANTARAFGKDLSRAVREYLEATK